MMRATTVFHSTQIDGIPVYNPPGIAAEPWRTPKAVQTILDNSGATIHYGGSQARRLVSFRPVTALHLPAAERYVQLRCGVRPQRAARNT
jgi:antirestriction protein ArdC